MENLSKRLEKFKRSNGPQNFSVKSFALVKNSYFFHNSLFTEIIRRIQILNKHYLIIYLLIHLIKFQIYNYNDD